MAGGEYVYGSVPFRHMMEARSVDIIMIDIMRSCGFTGFMKIAGMAEAFKGGAARLERSAGQRNPGCGWKPPQHLDPTPSPLAGLQ